MPESTMLKHLWVGIISKTGFCEKRNRKTFVLDLPVLNGGAGTVVEISVEWYLQ